MRIESIDFFYCSMPQVLDIGDGSQDALLVRVRANGFEGWGECEASPLTSIASFVCPMSHSACKPVSYSLVGRSLDSVADIQAISRSVKENSLDLLQADHTLSGIDIALYDLLGKKKGVPVFDLLGYSKPFPKLPYASQLFGDSPDDSFHKARKIREAGYQAMKFGWGPFGKDLAADIAHLQACREGIGNDAILMIDAGTAWVENVEEAAKRLDALKSVNTYWLEEPFVNMALQPYHDLSLQAQGVPLAGGEGCNNYQQAMAMMDYAGISFIQIDAGRVGGITVAKRVVDKAVAKGIRYVNHTFTSHLALSASLQAYAGIESAFISEYPVELKQLAIDITREKILPDANGYIHVPDGPGLGMTVDKEKLQSYLVKASIVVNGKTLYETPVLD